jgi:hypothetical protein
VAEEKVGLKVPALTIKLERVFVVLGGDCHVTTTV